MNLPVVAIVGRPNVGKSSLLNSLVGKRISIVDPTPGVTRDRIAAPMPLGEGYLELVDTGGIGMVDADELAGHVEEQIAYSIGAAAVILLVVDASEGLTPLDRTVAARLRKQDRPVILVANKVDQEDQAGEIHQFQRLGFGEPLPVSAAQGTGLTDLLEAIQGRLGKLTVKAPPKPVMKLAIVGKRNAGKSTLVNALAGQPRVIVSKTPGTTRDSVDVTIELDGRTFMLIDTAGVRKRKSLAGDIEYYGLHRAMRSIRRADVVALMIDASVPVSQVDKDLAGDIAKQFKPVVLVVNKWDLAVGKAAGEDYQEYFDKTFPELAFAPICMASAAEGTGVKEAVRLAEELFTQARRRVPTPRLNRVIQEILQLRGPSHKTGTKPPKILYASQIAEEPPTIVCFVNDVRSFDESYQRFLLNQMRQRLCFPEVPIRLVFRQRRQTKGRLPKPPRKAH